MLSLANELYYGSTLAERTALVEEALAMAQRLGDKALLLHGDLVGFAAFWVSATAEQRLARVTEAIALARELGQEQSYVVAATMRAVVEAELGLVEQMWQSWAHAMAEAERLHLPYGQLVLESLALPWLAMAGDFAAAEAALVRIIALDNRMSLEHSGDATAGALIGLRMWQGRGDEVTPVLAEMEGGPMPVTAIIIAMLLRCGPSGGGRRPLRGPPDRRLEPTTGSPPSTGAWPPRWPWPWATTRSRPTSTPVSLPTPVTSARPGRATQPARSTPSWRWPRQPSGNGRWPRPTPTGPTS